MFMDREDILKHKELAEDLISAFEHEGREDAAVIRAVLEKAEAATGKVSLETNEEEIMMLLVAMARPVIVECISFDDRKEVRQAAELMLDGVQDETSPIGRALRQLVIDMSSSIHPDQVELTDSRVVGALMMIPGVQIDKRKEVVH